MRNWGIRKQFRKGYESAKIRSWRNTIGAVFLVVGLVVALSLPVAWYWQIALYIAGMFVVGLIVQAFAMVRERHEPRTHRDLP
jgi:hypothetical protein